MDRLRLLALLMGLATILIGLGCSGSSSGPAPAPTTPYAKTVKTLVDKKTQESNEPESLTNLDLRGAETTDEHAFDPVLANH